MDAFFVKIVKLELTINSLQKGISSTIERVVIKTTLPLNSTRLFSVTQKKNKKTIIPVKVKHCSKTKTIKVGNFNRRTDDFGLNLAKETNFMLFQGYRIYVA